MTPEEQLEHADIIVSMWALGDRIERMRETLKDINAQIDNL